MRIAKHQSCLGLWRTRMGWSQRRAARALGVTLRGYQIWEWEVNTQGKPTKAPLRIRLAAAALESGLAPVGNTELARGTEA